MKVYYLELTEKEKEIICRLLTDEWARSLKPNGLTSYIDTIYNLNKKVRYASWEVKR